MTSILIRRFVKDHENIKDENVRNSYGRMASIVGVIVNVCVCLGELLVGLWVGSIAMVSDAIHNVADAGGSIVSFISFKVSAMQADEEHPYGHGRMEYILSIGFSFLLFVIAYKLLEESIHRILEPEVVEVSFMAILVMFGAMSMKIWLSRFLQNMGARIDSPILRANGLEALADVWATGSIIVGLLVGKYFQIGIDGYLGVFISLLVARSGWHVLRDATDRILGREPSPERIQEILDFVKSREGIISAHDLMIHDYGPGREYASLHVVVDASQDVMDMHDVIESMERDALRQLRLHMTAHMDPIVYNEQTKALYKRIESVVKAYNPDYGIYDVRLKEEEGQPRCVSFDLTVPLDDKSNEEDIRLSIEHLLKVVFPAFTTDIYVTKRQRRNIAVHEGTRTI